MLALTISAVMPVTGADRPVDLEEHVVANKKIATRGIQPITDGVVRRLVARRPT
jgi:hypothetical protein